MTGTSNSHVKLKKLKYQVTSFENKLNSEQRDACRLIDEKTLTTVSGRAGSGKTLLGCFVALQKFSNHEIDKIIITRPTVSTEDNGFLPGGIHDKLGPWVAPIYSNFRTILHSEKDPTSIELYDQLIQSNILEIVPVTFMRGRTFTNSIIIVDEAQNLTLEQMLMVVSRIGIGSKMIICGDGAQIDLRRKSESGMWLLDKLKPSPHIGSCQLMKNHRHPVVDEIIDQYESMNGAISL